eukprot:symbB.v1.2.030382.t1/scaffold3415.1/size57235/8
MAILGSTDTTRGNAAESFDRSRSDSVMLWGLPTGRPSIFSPGGAVEVSSVAQALPDVSRRSSAEFPCRELPQMQLSEASIRPDALVEYVPTGISASQGEAVGTEWNRVEDKS